MSRQPLQSYFSAYSEIAKTGVAAPATSKQAAIFNISALNGSGGAINVGICRKLVNAEWKFWNIVVASTPDAADATTAIQAGTATALFTTTTNDGFLIQSPLRFDLIGLNVSTAASGGSPVYTYQYYDGTTYQTLTTLAVPAYGSGTNIIAFKSPLDWALGTTAAVGGDTDKYSILVKASTASGTAGGSANLVWIGQMLTFMPSLANNTALAVTYPHNDPLVLNGGESIMPYFATANAANQIAVAYKILG